MGLAQLFIDAQFIGHNQKNSELTESVESKQTEIEKLSEELVSLKKEQIIRKLSEGLASTQIDKFEELTKDILWESEESFTKKANIIRESYFNKKSKTESVKKANESKKVKPTSKTVVVTEEIKDEKEDLSPLMTQYIKASTKLNNEAF